MCPHVAMHSSEEVAFGTMTESGKTDTAERGPIAAARPSGQSPKAFSNSGAIKQNAGGPHHRSLSP